MSMENAKKLELNSSCGLNNANDLAHPRNVRSKFSKVGNDLGMRDECAFNVLNIL